MEAGLMSKHSVIVWFLCALITSALGWPAHGAAQSTSSSDVGSGEQLWNFHAQNTDIVQGYGDIHARYSGINSLPKGGQIRETVSLDLFGGVRLWSGAEAHVDGLMWQGFGLHDTLGIDAFPNGEAYKVGTKYPRINLARAFIRQTIGLGGARENIEDDQLTLASRRDI